MNTATESPSGAPETRIGQSLMLRGITQKGKNRVRELGATWVIVRETDQVLFSSERGPWLLVEPAAGPDKSRWVHLRYDANFEVTPI